MVRHDDTLSSRTKATSRRRTGRRTRDDGAHAGTPAARGVRSGNRGSVLKALLSAVIAAAVAVITVWGITARGPKTVAPGTIRVVAQTTTDVVQAYSPAQTAQLKALVDPRTGTIPTGTARPVGTPAGVLPIRLTLTNADKQQARLTSVHVRSDEVPLGDLPALVVTGTRGEEEIPQLAAMLSQGEVGVGRLDGTTISSEPYLGAKGFTIDGKSTAALDVAMFTEAPRVHFSIELDVQVGDATQHLSITQARNGTPFDLVGLRCTPAGLPDFPDNEIVDAAPKGGLRLTALEPGSICSGIGATRLDQPRFLGGEPASPSAAGSARTS